MHCRFCHNRGHNRNSCPEVTKYAAEARHMITVEGKEEYTLSYRHRFSLAIERNKAQISANATAKSEAAKAQGLTSSRKCSYCDVTGHTRAKCSTLNSDKSSVIAYETRFRNAFALWLQHGGIGVGTMFQRITRYEDESTHVVMVTRGTDFSTVNLLQPVADGCVGGVFLNREGWENHIVDYAIPSGTGYPFADSHYGYIVVAPAPIPFAVAEDYRSEGKIKGFVDQLFDLKPKREYRWRRGMGHLGTLNTSRPNLASMLHMVEQMEKAADAVFRNAA